MEVNNIDKIKTIMSFKEGSFYKFEALIRSKDGDNPITRGYKSAGKKNMLLRTWFIDSEDKLNEKANEMIEFCRCTGSRLYMNADRKSTTKVMWGLIERVLEYLKTRVILTPKTIPNKYNSITSSISSSDIKRIVFDVDTKDKRVLSAVENFLHLCEAKYTVLDSMNGYHVVSTKFQTENAKDRLYIASNLSREEIDSFISFNENSLCLVFFDPSFY